MKRKIILLIVLYILMVLIVIWGVTSETMFEKILFGFLFIINIFNTYRLMQSVRDFKPKTSERQNLKAKK